MRARNIKPGLYRNEALAECSIAARYLAPGLTMMADREGRLEDRPKRIKGELLPYDLVDVEPLLIELDHAGFIARYEVDGRRIIQVVNFARHQNPHHREVDSVLPPSPGQRAVGTTQKPRAADASNQGEASDSPRAGLGLDGQESTWQGGRAGLIPSSLNPDSSGLDRPPTKSRSTRRPGGSVHEFPPGFERFWSEYPRKIGKKKASHAFAKCRPDAAMVDAMVAAIAAQRRCEQWRKDGGQFIPHPTTWLNEGRWLDEADTAASGVDSVFEGAR